MKIGIIATHSWPVPYRVHTGDHFYAGLARTLDEMGHEVTFFAPEESYVPPHGKLLSMPCSYGKYPPTSEDCEQQCFNMHAVELRKQDIIHDFSNTKRITENLYNEGYRNIISTPLGGNWHHPNPRHNIVVSSENMRQRGMRGATDYEGTPTPDMGGPAHPPIKDAHVVYYGIDTDFYTPTYDKEDFYLWMGRWHPVRGYKMAIDLARATGINLVMAGVDPEIEMFDYQKQCAYEAIEMAKDLPNVKFFFLPEDPDHHTTKRAIYQKAKAYLYTVQFQEPFGLSQPEALSCGTPVIGTNYGSVPEVITDGLTGYVCDNNIKSFADAILKVDKIKLETCREVAVKRFDRHTMALSYLKEYRSVLQGESW